MKQLSKPTNNKFYNFVDFELSEEEYKTEAKRMHKVQEAWYETFFGNDIKALHKLKYKRDITLEDGHVLKGAWCSQVRLDDNNKYIATFTYDEYLEE